MKKIFFFFIATIVFTSCAEELDLQPIDHINANNSLVNPQQSAIIIRPYKWVRLEPPIITSYPYNFASNNISIYQVNNDVYCAMGGLQEVLYKFNVTTLLWEPFEDPHQVALQLHLNKYLFSYDEELYYVDHIEEPYGEMMAINPITGTEVAGLANFPGIVADDMITFTIGTKGYVIGGNSLGVTLNQYWEYEFVLNKWTNKGTAPGGARAGGVAEVIGQDVYLGFGFYYEFVNGANRIRIKTDWVKLTPSANTGARQTPFPSYARYFSPSFTLGTKIYIGWGVSNMVGQLMDFWQYDTSTQVWTKISEGVLFNDNDHNIGAFSIGNNGYAVKGNLNESWSYRR